MLFTEPVFLLGFLPAVLVAHRLGLAAGGRAALWALLLASMVFYAWWSPGYLGMLLGSIGANYVLGTWLLAHRSRPAFVAGVTANLALLGVFKYLDFALGTVGLPLVHLVLPIGISFFTFQQIAWLVACFRGEDPHTGPFEYTLFVLFFPHFVAGPIVRHTVLIPQLLARPVPSPDDLHVGVAQFAIGWFKKVTLADPLSTLASPVFDGSAPVDAFGAWTATGAYALQLYLDFSGYSDMALGLARLFGIRLPVNFDAPYRARSPSEFWRRWHITLSEFLRDHLYLPLGGNRRGLTRTLVNLLVTMTLGGLWHGAGWTFVAWGALHGVYLVIARLWRGPPVPPAAAWALTQLAVAVAWVPFRAPTLGRAGELWQAMAGAHGLGAPTHATLIVCAGYGLCQLVPVGWRWAEQLRSRPLVTGLAVGAMAALAVAASGQLSPFLYYQF